MTASEVEGWDGLVMEVIEQHRAIGAIFDRAAIYRHEAYFARRYPTNRAIRASLARVLRALVASGEIEAVGKAQFRRVH